VRADLADVWVCLNWAIAQLNVLNSKIVAWQSNAPYRLREEPHPERGEKLIRLANVKQPSPLINVEVGMIVHCIRSALDILMVKLAEREGHAAPTDVYFPVAGSREDFFEGRSPAIKKIDRLSDVDKRIVENLKPYKGGDKTLYAIHRLDIMRKHQRLIAVSVVPFHFVVSPYAWNSGEVKSISWNGFQDDAVVGSTSINTPDHDIVITPQITFEGTGLPVDGQFVLKVLADFAGRADQIIKLFDIA
jgi:hypothetical protein